MRRDWSEIKHSNSLFSLIACHEGSFKNHTIKPCIHIPQKAENWQVIAGLDFWFKVKTLQLQFELVACLLKQIWEKKTSNTCIKQRGEMQHSSHITRFVCSAITSCDQFMGIICYMLGINLSGGVILLSGYI